MTTRTVAAPCLLRNRADAPSWQARAIAALMTLGGRKARHGTVAGVQAHVAREARRPTADVAPGPGAGFGIARGYLGGWPVYRTAPCAASGQHVFYLHGGYIRQIARAHWRFVRQMTLEAAAQCTVPIYPLAPRATAATVVPAVAGLLRGLMDSIGAARVTLVGDSAGGGMALAVAQYLRDLGLPQPRALVLLSPWLDATMDRPEQVAIARCDPMQDLPGMAEAGRIYAGALPPAHPFVSPLRGELRGIAPITVLTGTRDLLHPDSLALAELARRSGVPLELHVQRGQLHNFALMPTPEGRRARSLVAARLR